MPVSICFSIRPAQQIWIKGSNTAYWGTQYTRFFYPTVGMKTTEVYLMLAECLAPEDKFQEAVDVLNKLRAKRICPAP